MILTASRRTDIPALYSDWMMHRLQEGYVLVPHPRNPKRIRHVTLSPDNVDAIVFWTKNPAPMFSKLPLLDQMGYPYAFQYTLTPYDRKTETRLPETKKRVQTFIELAKKLGSHRVIWRYDPIFIDEKHSVFWHIQTFYALCKQLSPFTDRCIISFMDIYTTNRRDYRIMTREEIFRIAAAFSQIAASFRLPLFTCGEKINLHTYGIEYACCIDPKMIEKIIGCPINAKRDPNQRPTCRCLESIDIGIYNTCIHGCTYCYATNLQRTAIKKYRQHDPKAPMLTGFPKGDEIITERIYPSIKRMQMSLFDKK